MNDSGWYARAPTPGMVSSSFDQDSPLLARTDGVTPSFLEELIRRACVLSPEADPDAWTLRVGADSLDAALDELLDTRNAMTRVLLAGTTQT